MSDQREIIHRPYLGTHLVRTPDLDIRFAVTNGDASSLQQIMAPTGGFNDIETLIIDGKTLLISKNGFEFYSPEKPYKTGNESDAIYLARHKAEGLEILLQYMPPNSRTSHHWHEAEVFIPVSGSLFIWIDQKKVNCVDRRVDIDQGATHIGFTFDKPALTLVFSMGDIYSNHLPRPSIEFLHQQARL